MSGKITVKVDDNYHYQDQDHRYTLGEFDDLAAAVAACQRIVDRYLAQAFEPGMTAGALYRSYTSFGEDPFIVGVDGDLPFSAWEYAMARCAELCNGGPRNGP